MEFVAVNFTDSIIEDGLIEESKRFTEINLEHFNKDLCQHCAWLLCLINITFLIIYLTIFLL